MAPPDVCLLAPRLTQDLLNLKWAWRAAAHASGSPALDSQVDTWILTPHKEWSRQDLERLLTRGCLVFLCGKGEPISPDLAAIAGFAFARKVPLIWIGPSLPLLERSERVSWFPTAEDCRQQILREIYSPRAHTIPDRVAA